MRSWITSATRTASKVTAHKTRHDRAEIGIVKTLLGETRNPIFALLNRLRAAEGLQKSIQRYGVSATEFNRFERVVFSSDVKMARTLLGWTSPPSWLVLQMAAHKVRHRDHAETLLNLVYSHLPHAPADICHPLLVLSALALSRYNVVSPLPHLVQTFLNLTPTHPDLNFNLLLRVISLFRIPEETAESTTQMLILLQAMESRNIPLRPLTYRTLLTDRFLALQIAKMLQERMIQQGDVPTRTDMEYFLRIFSKNGAIHDAISYAQAIRAYEVGISLPPHRQSPTIDTHLIRAMNSSRASAFQYLRHLLQEENSTRVTSQARVRRPTTIFEWTAALTAASKDKTLSAEDFLQFVARAEAAKHAFKPTMTTYTVIMHGLCHRKAFDEAVEVWNTLRAKKPLLDGAAVAAGIRSLIRAGKPLEAFNVLEEFAAAPKPMVTPPAPPEIWKLHKNQRQRYQQRKVVFSMTSINETLKAFEKLGRPDIVFFLWDHMSVLYATASPNAQTLGIVLSCARLATKLDDSLSGTLLHFTSKIPFRKAEAVQTMDRGELVEKLRSIIGDKEGTRSESGYVSRLWAGLPPWRRALDLFQYTLFENWPKLRDYKPGQLPISKPLKAETSSLSGSMQIVPTDDTFKRYILLLGTHSLQAEIPLALTWMRALDIPPSHDTLAMAVVLYAEVSKRAPLAARFGIGQGAYSILVRWLIGWVGADGFPDDAQIGGWIKRIERIRTHGGVEV